MTLLEIRKLIRKTLSEQYIDEAGETYHSIEREEQRVLDLNEVEIGYELPGPPRGNFESVGTYMFPEEIKKQIIERLSQIKKTNLPPNKTFAIKIAEVWINPSKVKYYSGYDINDTKGKSLIFLIEDSYGKSYGNVLFAITRGNLINTILWKASKDSANIDVVRNRLRVDQVIKNIQSFSSVPV